MPRRKQPQLSSLRELRESAGVTQVDLAHRIGWPQSRVSKVERRAAIDNVWPSTIAQYLEGLGLDLVMVATNGKVEERIR